MDKDISRNNEVLQALKIIKSVCEINDNCSLCPLCTVDKKCGIESPEPQFWELNSSSNWKAFTNA